jgi:hypothetical protein
MNGRWVVYGLGNFVSNHRPETGWPSASEDGAVVTVAVSEQPGGGFTVDRPVVHPTWSHPKSYVTFDALAHAADPAFSRADQRRLARSLARSTKLLGDFFPEP